MNDLRLRYYKIYFLLLQSTLLVGQQLVEYLGLNNKIITSLDVYDNIVAIGTNGDGVFQQVNYWLPDSDWVYVGLEGENVTSVYLHKSGPFWWGMTVGVFPAPGESDYVYCSFGGEELIPNSAGITDSIATGIYRLAGFPDPTICGEKYAAAGGALYRQLFGDSLWNPVYASPGIEGPGIIYVKTLENTGGFVLAGGSEGYTGVLLIKSVDFGDTWEHLYPPGPVFSFSFDLDSLLTDFETIFVSHGTHISRSSDGGDSWDIVYNDGGNFFGEIVYNPHSNFVFAAGGDGLDTSSAVLIYSRDLGNTWNPIPLNMTGPIVGLDFGLDNNIYFAAPYSGVFRLSLSELSIDSGIFPQSVRLYQNYPNPFNPNTIIAYDLSKDSYVTITVFDLKGRAVANLVDGFKPSGFYKITWHAGQLSSGLYFVKLKAGDYLQTKKVVLMK